MPEQISLKAAFNLSPEKAIEYFESKGYRISIDWHEMQREAHTKAFTVAGVVKAEILKDIREALTAAEKDGLSYSEFKSNIIPTLQKKGWFGKKEILRADGSLKEVDLSVPHRLKTIFNTNMRTSMMAGQYKSMIDAAKTRPYWKYIAVMDNRTREAHVALNGKIFKFNDPFWNTHFPPNGWGCRCRVISISKEEFEEKNYELSNGEILKNSVLIAPEWAYNPGIRNWKSDLNRYEPKTREKLKNEFDEIKKEAQLPRPAEKIRASNDEIYAAYKYKSFDAYEINENTREGKTLPADRQGVVKNISSLLEKLPPYKGVVKRSLHFYSQEKLDRYLKIFDNEIIDFKQFVSTTCGEVYNPDSQVLVIINSKTGVDFRQFNPEEQEIIFKQGTKFKLLSKKVTDGKYYITLKEIEQ